MEKIYKLLNSNEIDAEIGLNLLVKQPIEKIVLFFTIYKKSPDRRYMDIKSKLKNTNQFYIRLENDYVIRRGYGDLRLRKIDSYGYCEKIDHILNQDYLNGNY